MIFKSKNIVSCLLKCLLCTSCGLITFYAGCGGIVIFGVLAGLYLENIITEELFES